jgi:hypothetical protein
MEPESYYVQNLADEYAHQDQQDQMVALDLVVSDQPVWEEDERAERDSLRRLRQPIPEPTSAAQARDILDQVTVGLPDVLLPIWKVPEGVQRSGGTPDHAQALEASYGRLAADGFACPGLAVPVSFQAPPPLTLRRLRMMLELTNSPVQADSPSPDPAAGPGWPVVLHMEPTTAVEETSVKIGEIGIDVGRVVSALIPAMPDIFTARVGASLEVGQVRPQIQAEGLLRHACSWRVSAPSLAYYISPWIVAQFPLDRTVLIKASLHVEIRRTWLGGLIHRTYAKSATPRTYECRPGASRAVAQNVSMSRGTALRRQQELDEENLAAFCGGDDSAQFLVDPDVLYRATR